MSALVDDGADGANMYGCTPCPKCHGRYRYPSRYTYAAGRVTEHTEVQVVCDDCPYFEGPAVRADGSEWTR